MPADAPSTGESAPNPGSQTALRHSNEQRIIDTLVANGPSTQAELSRGTGLSTATVSNIVRRMKALGLVSTTPTTSSGRRALSVRLNARGIVAGGIDFGRRHVRVVLAGIGYDLIADEEVTLPRGHRAEEGLDTAADLLAKLLAEHGIEREAVLGLGVGIPGPIDRRSGSVVHGTILPEWVGLNLLHDLSERLQFPVLLDNDANLGALAQVTWGPYAAVDNLVFLKVGSGIGAGLIINGAPFYGNIGITGEIGHSTIEEQGRVCACGNRGCLETVASTSVMIELLSRREQPKITTEDIVARTRAGDPATLRVLEDAGLALGRAMGNVANLVNPEVIVVGGPLAGLGEQLLEPIRRGLQRYALPVIGETTTLTVSSLGERAEALGAAALVFQRLRVADAMEPVIQPLC